VIFVNRHFGEMSASALLAFPATALAAATDYSLIGL